jgi:hypothetical protein
LLGRSKLQYGLSFGGKVNCYNEIESKTGGLWGEAANLVGFDRRRKFTGRWRHPNRCRLNCNGSNTSGQAACAALLPPARL